MKLSDMFREAFKFVVSFLVIVMVLAVTTADANARKRTKNDLIPDPKKYAALVIHADTGMVLHEKNADKPRYPASLVKMMTLYLTFEAIQSKKIDINQHITASRHAAAQPSLNIGLKSGEKIKVRDAIYALVVRSANDVSVALAEAIAGSEKKFVERMNATARRLNMNNTTFRNPSGLPDKRQISTARDMAKLLIALQSDFPKQYRYMSKTNFLRKGRQYKTHNRVLLSYLGADGGKTGYISASGFNLATSARRRGHSLVAVILGGKTSSSRDKIMVSLLDKGFRKLGGVSSSELDRVANVPPPTLRPWEEPSAISSLNDSEDRNLWSIELGGFGQEYEAINAVTMAMDKIPEQLAYSHINFVNKSENGSKSHWARFVRLTEQQAKQACQVLQSSHTDCKILDK